MTGPDNCFLMFLIYEVHITLAVPFLYRTYELHKFLEQNMVDQM